MAANSSSFSLPPYIQHCFDFGGGRGGTVMVLAFIIVNFFLFLPLSLLVLYLGYRRWRQQCSFATTSHSDIFTYHFAAMELIYALGSTFSLFGKLFGLPQLLTVGFYSASAFYPGQNTFQVLTCVERYLAVVHPVIYLGLRQSGGVMIRNISIGCSWLLYCGWMGMTALYLPDVPYIPIFCALTLSIVIVSFCSISVLRVLIRPGPGERGGGRVQVDQSKRRAFNTIMAITGALWLFFLGVLVCVALESSHLLGHNDGCLVLISGNWFSLPCTFILPVLFVHRAGKLPCCHSSYD